MRTKSSVLVTFLILVMSMHLFSQVPTRGSGGDEKTVWAEPAAMKSGSKEGNSQTQYYLYITTDPPGIASPTGGGWYDTGTNATLSTQDIIDVDHDRSRYKFTSWRTPNMSEIDNPLLSTASILVDKTKTVTANYVLQYKVVFEQSGTYETPHEDTIVQVDGANYYYNTMPASFWYDDGSNHTFYYEKSIVVTTNKKAYIWASTTGLSTAQSGSITVSSSGNIRGNYKTQYYLSVASQHGTPNPTSNWFDSGSEVVASLSSPLSGDSGTRYVCTGWTGTGSVLASGSDITTTFIITQSSKITWNWKTQFLLTVSTSLASVSPQPSRLPTGEAASTDTWWYDSSTNVTLTAGTASSTTFEMWEVDGKHQGQEANPIIVTMNTTHIAIAYYTTGLVGDINADGKVDMRDISYVAKRFLCNPGDALWDSVADINADGKIDIKDIDIVTGQFGMRTD